jgi:hypothetical protein
MTNRPLVTHIQLVDRYSAVIPGMQNAESIGLNKDHVSMAKFDRYDDWDFTVVASHLSDMADAAPLQTAKIWESYERHERTYVSHKAKSF